MIKICITLDDVLRAKTKQFGVVYKKFIDNDIDLGLLDLHTNDLMTIFGFKSKKEFHKFLYEDYAFEIFAEAPATESGVDKKLNLWHLSLNDDDEIDDELDLMIANPMEFNASIGYTYFFLSKMATRVREIYLPSDSLSILDRCDIIITSDPKLLSNINKNQVGVKINMDYNSDISSENIVEYKSLNEFISNSNNLREIINKFKKINQ